MRGRDLTGRHAFVYYLFARGAVAQLEEHLNGIQGVRGSSPLSSTKDFKGLANLLTLFYLILEILSHLYPTIYASPHSFRGLTSTLYGKQQPPRS